MPDPAGNPGLVADCKTLLAAKDQLVGDASLDWSADLPIWRWEGVTVGGRPRRVTELRLREKQLNGNVRPALGT